MKTYELQPLPDKAGDKMYACFYTANGANRCIGTVRFNPRTSDYQAVRQTMHGPKGRYFGTMAGAANWLVRRALETRHT